mmetsp:Transcript_87480/g.260970  ORF Transcript_87480/g.260970 Transcript_87480/m.260970 type:complete len:268 (+) Transcript_87480:1128-1931(+)
MTSVTIATPCSASVSLSRSETPEKGRLTRLSSSSVMTGAVYTPVRKGFSSPFSALSASSDGASESSSSMSSGSCSSPTLSSFTSAVTGKRTSAELSGPCTGPFASAYTGGPAGRQSEGSRPWLSSAPLSLSSRRSVSSLELYTTLRVRTRTSSSSPPPTSLANVAAGPGADSASVVSPGTAAGFSASSWPLWRTRAGRQPWRQTVCSAARATPTRAPRDRLGLASPSARGASGGPPPSRGLLADAALMAGVQGTPPASAAPARAQTA